jgi:VIT family
MLGLAAATADAHIVLSAGLAATFAESVSMGAVAYTSNMAEADVYAAEKYELITGNSYAHYANA